MTTANQNYELIPYQAANGMVMDVIKYQNDIWMTQKQIAKLFGCDIRTVSEHLTNIFECDELDKNSVIRKFRITAPDGKKYNTKHYNRRGIFHIGYRVNSKMGVAFRNWTSDVLEEKVTGQGTDENKIITEKKVRAALINEKLKKMGITQKQIGEELGLSYVSVSYAINGKTFSFKVENWLKENLFKEPEHSLVSKSEEIAKNALKADYESFKKLMTIFETAYNFVA